MTDLIAACRGRGLTITMTLRIHANIVIIRPTGSVIGRDKKMISTRENHVAARFYHFFITDILA